MFKLFFFNPPYCHLQLTRFRCSVQTPSPTYFSTPCIPNNPLNPSPSLCLCVCEAAAQCALDLPLPDSSAVEREALAALVSQPLDFVPASSASCSHRGSLWQWAEPSTDSIWSDLRKRTGTITLFSFFRWVPSERRKEGRGEEVNKPSAFLQKNKETLDRHLHFLMK